MSFMPKAVLFDLDGTFVDTAPDLAAALNVILQSKGKAPLPLTEVVPYASTGTRGLLKLGLGIEMDHPDYPALSKNFLAHYEENIAANSRVFPGFEALIQHFNANNIAWGIVTNKPESLSIKLFEQMDFPFKPQVLVGGDTTSERKPSPVPIIYACEKLGVAPTDCIYVGDADRDVEAGRRAGAKTLGAAYGYILPEETAEGWQADWLIETPDEILNWYTTTFLPIANG